MEVKKTISVLIIALLFIGCPAADTATISPGNCTLKVYGETTQETRLVCSISGDVLTLKDRAEGKVAFTFKKTTGESTGEYTAWRDGKADTTPGDVTVNGKEWIFSVFETKIAEVILD